METKSEPFSLLRAHAVLAALSVAMIGQIVSASTVTPPLKLAVYCFAISVLLNTLCYWIEAENPPIQKPRLWHVLFFTNASFIGKIAAICGVGYTVSHFEEWAGGVFMVLGVLGVMTMYARRFALCVHVSRSLDKLFKQIESLSAEYAALIRERRAIAAEPAEERDRLRAEWDRRTKEMDARSWIVDQELLEFSVYLTQVVGPFVKPLRDKVAELTASLDRFGREK